MKNLFESLSEKWSTPVNEATKPGKTFNATKDRVQKVLTSFEAYFDKKSAIAVLKAFDKYIEAYDFQELLLKNGASSKLASDMHDALLNYNTKGYFDDEITEEYPKAKRMIKESVTDIEDETHDDSVTQPATTAAPKDTEEVIDFENPDKNKDAKFNDAVTQPATTDTELNSDNIKMEGFKASELKDNNDYLVTYKGAEAYMEYKGKKNGKHQFDNSGKITELTDAEVAKHVTNESVNEAYKGARPGDITDLTISAKGKPGSETASFVEKVANKFKNAKFLHTADYVHVTLANEKDKSDALDMFKDRNKPYINESVNEAAKLVAASSPQLSNSTKIDAGNIMSADIMKDGKTVELSMYPDAKKKFYVSKNYAEANNIIESVNEEMSYQDFFKKKLKKYGVDSIGALGDKKSDFFTEIEKEWDNDSKNESVTDIEYETHDDSVTQPATTAAPKDTEEVIDFENLDKNKDAKFNDAVTQPATTNTELNSDNIKFESIINEGAVKSGESIVMFSGFREEWIMKEYLKQLIAKTKLSAAKEIVTYKNKKHGTYGFMIVGIDSSSMDRTIHAKGKGIDGNMTGSGWNIEDYSLLIDGAVDVVKTPIKDIKHLTECKDNKVFKSLAESVSESFA